MDKKASILCVDDEPVNLVILEELLQSSYALNSVNSGESCLQQVGIDRPDLILLDVNMPEMDGLETCERLKADTDTAEIPVIFVSALATQEELMAGYEAGMLWAIEAARPLPAAKVFWNCRDYILAYV